MQTAHTEPPGKGSGTFAAAVVSNELSGVAGRTAADAQSVQAAPRLGLSRHVDVGLQPWMLIGLRSDVKVNLFAPEQRLAVAPRAGAGYAHGGDARTFMGMAGAIFSYRVSRGFEPYLGTTYANHWISRPIFQTELQPGESLVPRDHTGDGLAQLTVGFEAGGSSMSVLLEYNLWLPANNDPGDGYAFVHTHVFAIGIAFFSPSRRPPPDPGQP
jgi:hypothetical protein